MNATELLCYLTERQVDSLFRAARSLPADKLDWQPTPASRSALDQLQEVATALEEFWDMFVGRKVEFNEERRNKWLERRGQIRDIDELERLCREQTKRLIDFIRTLSDEDLSAPVELPFPGEHKFADILGYHLWNSSYHEGQIYYIGTLLAADAQG